MKRILIVLVLLLAGCQTVPHSDFHVPFCQQCGKPVNPDTVVADGSFVAYHWSGHRVFYWCGLKCWHKWMDSPLLPTEQSRKAER